MNGSWEWPQIGEVLNQQPNKKIVQQGWSPRCHAHPAPDGKWGVLKTTAIQAGRFEPQHNKELPPSLKPRPAIEVQAGDLLLTCAGPRARCGVPALVKSTPARLMMSGKMYRFRPSERLDPRFLELWLLSPRAQKLIDEMKTGISDSGLNLTHGRFATLPVPVPPLTEQRRIVEILEEQLSHLDIAGSDLDAGIQRLHSFRQSAVHAAISRSTDERVHLGDVLREPLMNGRSVPSEEGGFPVLRLTAIANGAIDLSERKGGRWQRADAQKYLVRRHDMLVSRGNGSLQRVGRAGIVIDAPDEVAFPDTMIRVRVRRDAMLPTFATILWNSSSVRDQIEGAARTTAGIYKVNQKDLLRIALPLPEMDQQAAIVMHLDEVAERTQRLVDTVRSAIARSVELRRTLLYAAFSGRLTGRSSDRDVIEELVEQPLAAEVESGIY